MKPSRRRLLHLAVAATVLAALRRSARAQAYPARPVRILVGFGSGSAFDILARLIGQWLSERMGQPFVIENRGGAGGSLASEAAVRAPPDGYTLLLCGSPDRSTLPFTTSSLSISSATSRRSGASPGRRMCW
jgi:tripartite-type tricarboxylate transporter receptor subunit TctC